MISSKLKDREKLIIIAQTYSYIKGEVNSEILFDFIRNHNYNFKQEINRNNIGKYLGNSPKFEKTRKNVNVFNYIAKDKKNKGEV